MTLSTQDGTQTNRYSGLYLRTRKQTRFWGWSSAEWSGLNAAEHERPLGSLAEWLRQAHLRLDREADALPAISDTRIADSAAQCAPECGTPAQPRRGRKLEFVCNRRFVGWIIR
jgi:hypothetical protein